MVLYRNPAIGLDAAHDYRIMYEARAEPALSTRDSLMISYNVNSEAVTTGCVPMSAFTNTVTQPRFISVPLAAFGTARTCAGHTALPGPGGERPGGLPAHRAAAPVPVVQFLELPGRLPAGARAGVVHARPGAGKVTLSWPDAGLGVRYQVYLQGPTDIPAVTEYGTGATLTGLRSGAYLARVVPVNFKEQTGRAAKVTFTVP